METRRPDPDALLHKVIQEDDQIIHRAGHLKIFFGYAAGVGKTYSMLEAAHAAKDAGIDVVAGYIEPHTRPETLKLLDGLEQLSPLDVKYKGITLREFDLDAALERHPQLILVDELAHSNAEGCRHRKRYQDIEELLKAGIDVYTTINVQHIESLNDVVASITGVIVRERVPDRVFDQADQVELVDIEPEELIKRLDRGKIYRTEQARQALAHFFVPKNLVALREIALRRTADRVSRRAEEDAKIDRQRFAAEEHIMICLSASPSNANVIRTAARMADAFHGAFTALFVETSGDITEDAQKNLRENLHLAEQLGAKVATVYGDDIPMQIAEYAQVSGVTKVVLGRSNNRRRMFSTKKNFVDRLTVLAPELDIYIIPDSRPPYAPARRSLKGLAFQFSWVDLGKMVAILVMTSLVCMLFDQFGFSEANIITLYILGVLFISMCTKGVLYGLIASLVNVFIFNFLFTDPRFTLQAYDSGYPITFLVMFAAALVTSTLTMRVKSQAHRQALKAWRTEVLLETSQKLQRAKDEATILSETAEQLKKLFDCSILFYPSLNGVLQPPLYFPKAGEEGSKRMYATLDEQGVAQWVFKNNKHAGATTNTLPGARCLYMAVRNHDTVFAVVGIALNERVLEAFDRNLLVALLGECALALEKEKVGRAKNEIELKAQREQLRANLLRTISHDLRTPLTSISGNANILLGNAAVLDEAKRRQLYTDIYDDSMWLINLVENLLAVTRIENGSMDIHMEPELLGEVIQEAMDHLSRHRDEHKISVQLKDDMLMARMDSRLIIQVIINIVNNAIKYTPAGSKIVIRAFAEEGMVHVEIADNGKGIPDDAKTRLFDMFYTANNHRGDGRRGLGLGLSLCKSIISAHGGTIGVRDNVPHGALFYFTLQAEEVDLHE
jgi:two-component system sensor histidine kinase KdpD